MITARVRLTGLIVASLLFILSYFYLPSSTNFLNDKISPAPILDKGNGPATVTITATTTLRVTETQRLVVTKVSVTTTTAAAAATENSKAIPAIDNKSTSKSPVFPLLPSLKYPDTFASREALAQQTIPKEIFQTWKDLKIPGEAWLRYTSWLVKNPDHQHTLFTDKSAVEWVTRNFATRPDIVHVFTKVRTKIIQADLLRYLVLYLYGGLYTDLDTSCTQPIDTWFKDFKQTDYNFVVGVEVDEPDMDMSRIHDAGWSGRIQFLQWTLYGKPHHEILNMTIDRAIKTITDHVAGGASPIEEYNFPNNFILTATGPFQFSQVIRDYLKQVTGKEVPNSEFSRLKEPKLIADILFLPVNAWSPEAPHSQSGFTNTSLVRHWFKGAWKWGGYDETTDWMSKPKQFVADVRQLYGLPALSESAWSASEGTNNG